MWSTSRCTQYHHCLPELNGYSVFALKIRFQPSAAQLRRGLCRFINVNAGNDSTMALLGPLHVRHVSVGVAHLDSLPRVFADDIKMNPWLSLFWRGRGGWPVQLRPNKKKKKPFVRSSFFSFSVTFQNHNTDMPSDATRAEKKTIDKKKIAKIMYRNLS